MKIDIDTMLEHPFFQGFFLWAVVAFLAIGYKLIWVPIFG